MREEALLCPRCLKVSSGHLGGTLLLGFSSVHSGLPERERGRPGLGLRAVQPPGPLQKEALPTGKLTCLHHHVTLCFPPRSGSSEVNRLRQGVPVLGRHGHLTLRSPGSHVGVITSSQVMSPVLANQKPRICQQRGSHPFQLLNITPIIS